MNRNTFKIEATEIGCLLPVVAVVVLIYGAFADWSIRYALGAMLATCMLLFAGYLLWTLAVGVLVWVCDYVAHVRGKS